MPSTTICRPAVPSGRPAAALLAFAAIRRAPTRRRAGVPRGAACRPAVPSGRPAAASWRAPLFVAAPTRRRDGVARGAASRWPAAPQDGRRQPLQHATASRRASPRGGQRRRAANCCAGLVTRKRSRPSWRAPAVRGRSCASLEDPTAIIGGMPIYEYRCEGCEHRFETLIRGAETPACPTCGSQSLAREFSTFAVSTGGGGAMQLGGPGPVRQLRRSARRRLVFDELELRRPADAAARLARRIAAERHGRPRPRVRARANQGDSLIFRKRLPSPADVADALRRLSRIAALRGEAPVSAALGAAARAAAALDPKALRKRRSRSPGARSIPRSRRRSRPSPPTARRPSPLPPKRAAA